MNLTKKQARVLNKLVYTNLDLFTKNLYKIRTDMLCRLINKGMVKRISGGKSVQWELTETGRAALKEYDEFRNSLVEDDGG